MKGGEKHGRRGEEGKREVADEGRVNEGKKYDNGG